MTRTIMKLPHLAVFALLMLFFFVAAALPRGISAIGILPLFLWLYSLALETHKLLPSDTTLKLIRIKLALAYSFIYYILAELYFPVMMPYAAPFHILAMFCMFYSLYFAAKCIKGAEKGREAKFEDYFAVFMGLWFFPIGVWFIQPKVQRILKLK